MKLLPHQMLSILGFNVPPQGVEIDDADFGLCMDALRLIGKEGLALANVDKAPLESLKKIHTNLGGRPDFNDNCEYELKSTLKDVLKVRLKLVN
jgi:hypothetical protein